MEKGKQGIRFPQAFDGDGKGGVVQHPDEEPVDVWLLQQAEESIHPRK
jgi:hypothetical protein